MGKYTNGIRMSLADLQYGKTLINENLDRLDAMETKWSASWGDTVITDDGDLVTQAMWDKAQEDRKEQLRAYQEQWRETTKLRHAYQKQGNDMTRLERVGESGAVAQRKLVLARRQVEDLRVQRFGLRKTIRELETERDSLTIKLARKQRAIDTLWISLDMADKDTLAGHQENRELIAALADYVDVHPEEADYDNSELEGILQDTIANYRDADNINQNTIRELQNQIKTLENQAHTRAGKCVAAWELVKAHKAQVKRLESAAISRSHVVRDLRTRVRELEAKESCAAPPARTHQGCVITQADWDAMIALLIGVEKAQSTVSNEGCKNDARPWRFHHWNI